MSEEKKYFICRNGECQKDSEGIDGGMVFQYEITENENAFVCPNCKSKYIEIDNTIFYYAVIDNEEITFDGKKLLQNIEINEETVIASSNDFSKLTNQFESNRIYFPRLVLKNIDEPDFQGKKIAFNNCLINELIIEDVNITSAYYPILFSGCVINKIRISNSKVRKTNLNNYKSLWSFFGISFFNTTIFDDFKIEKSETRLMISNCGIKCPVQFSKSSKVELALIDNQDNPEIKEDEDSNVTQLLETIGKSPSASKKKISINGTAIQNISIDELHIDPDIKTSTVVENCSVCNLIFESGSSIKGKLVFKNCLIENIQNTPYCFEQDLVFHGCTFKNEFLLTRSNFNQSLIFEFCSFEENTIFNDLNINDDFQLSYSAIKKNLFVSGNKCGNYIKCHLNTVQDEIKFEDNVVARDVNFRALQCNSNIEFTHNKITGYLFLRQININGNVDIRMLKADALTIDETYIGGLFDFSESYLDTDLRIGRLEVRGITSFTENILGGGIFLKRSLFEESLNLISIKSRLNFFTNLDVKSNCNFNSCTFSQQTFTSQNVFLGEFSWHTMNTHNISLSSNVVVKSIEINKSKSNDISINDNQIDENLEIISAEATEITISACRKIGKTKLEDCTVNGNLKIKNNNFVKDIFLNRCKIYQDLDIEDNRFENFKLSNLKLENIKIDDNIFETFVFNIVKADDIFFRDNRIANNVMIIYAKCEDLIFQRNVLPQFLINMGNFTGISISNSEIDYNSISHVTTHRDIKVENNRFGEFTLDNILSNDIMFNDNEIHRYANINDTKANDIFIRRNNLHDKPEASEGENNETDSNHTQYGLTCEKCNVEGELSIKDNYSWELLKIIQSFADTLTCERNLTKSIKVSMGKYRKMYILNCLKVGDFTCNNVSISKDASFKHNIFHRDFTMLWCKIENDLEFSGNEFKNIHRLRNNTVLGSLTYETTTIQETYFSFSPEKMNIGYKLPLLQDYSKFYSVRDVAYTTSFHSDMVLRYNKFNKISMEDAHIESTLYFENNSVQDSFGFGNQKLHHDIKDITFSKALSITKNKINNAAFYNICFESPVCLHQNTFVGDLIFRNTDHQNALDFTGCFVGGSFEIHNTRAGNDDGDLILDNTFVDKRLSFTKYTPKSLSFINATFNGFEIPGNWRMQWKKLIDKNRLSGRTLKVSLKKLRTFLSCPKMLFWGNKGSYIFKENTYLEAKCKQRYKDTGLPYSFMKDFYSEYTQLKQIPDLWKSLKTDVFFDGPKLAMLDQTHRRKDKASDAELIRYYYDWFNKCIEEDFLPVYYKYFNEKTMSEIIETAKYLGETANNYKDAESKATFDQLKTFFSLFHTVLDSFHKHTFEPLAVIDAKGKREYKNSIRKRLEEQYHVLRHIWGSNGELKEEDTAYYTWMHHKNIADMHDVSILNKLKSWIRYFLYEKVFGWGVRLPRIVLSTIVMIFIFSFIYYFMFLSNPELRIVWDGQDVPASSIGWLKSIVFAIQTTFSAGLGDWAPIGSGSIKIPMTINAVLGVLMVTFLIGAYGRKMLR